MVATPQIRPEAHPEIPTTARNVDEAVRRFGAKAETYFAGMWRGDELADAFVADFAEIGHGKAMKMLRTACRKGIDAVPNAPQSLRDLFAELDTIPAWLDLDWIDDHTRHLPRYTRQAGITLGAASLVSGYANSAASRPLELTGRYVENAGMRTIEVGSWLIAINERGGLRRYSHGFELTVRVRIIHALVRHSLSRSPEWDEDAWGVPICQAFLAYTLIEFCLIPLRGMRAIGAPYQPDEVEAYYRSWRYVGHLLGIEENLLPVNQHDQEVLEDLYLLTRPEVDDYCRSLVAAINEEFLVPEIEEILPRQLHHMAPPTVAALERIFLGDQIADELGVDRAPRMTAVLRVLGPILATLNALLDRMPGVKPLRTRLGLRYRDKQDERLRTRYGVQHDLVDDSPAGGKAHPARAH
ncbi:oxygenase MpaB family protein [Nocardioides sp. AE5]|uniref:oxygenase MpaB family protein n=1 Tax=Nocardioides sp. AE5 TaxID=2962573 RepID=UPI0028820DF8|nr:oxygenase MpaB family protein [Nocardioides sp. AE5]MDT0201218.1 oxygenase MpaB family protein [Nocardioides sp. AE5]